MSVGTDAAAAYNSRIRKQREFDALAAGLLVSNPIEDDSRLRIQSAAGDFLEEVQLTRQKKTLRLHDFSEVERMPNVRYRVLLGNPQRIAAMIVNGQAV